MRLFINLFKQIVKWTGGFMIFQNPQGWESILITINPAIDNRRSRCDLNSFGVFGIKPLLPGYIVGFEIRKINVMHL